MNKNSPSLKVHILAALQDNYIYVVENTKSKNAFCIDPGESQAVLNFFKTRHDLKLTDILLTHHHGDHVAGVYEICEKHPAHVLGPPDQRLEHIRNSTHFSLSSEISIEIIETPGHTIPAWSYFINSNEAPLLFCGDTLFLGGCGRLFEGSPAQMWESLLKLRTLPSESLIYCGHEYTETNMHFVNSLNWRNSATLNRLKEIKEQLKTQKNTMASTLKSELLCNPFLNADDPELALCLGLDKNTLAENVFEKLRDIRNSFKII